LAQTGSGMEVTGTKNVGDKVMWQANRKDSCKHNASPVAWFDLCRVQNSACTLVCALYKLLACLL